MGSHSENRIVKFWKGAAAYARRRTVDEEWREDFPTWALVKFLEGRKASYAQFWVDYIRERVGRSGNLRVETVDAAIVSLAARDQWEALEIRIMAEGLTEEERRLVELAADGQKEAAAELGLTQGGVSWKLDVLREKWTRRIAREVAGESVRKVRRG